MPDAPVNGKQVRRDAREELVNDQIYGPSQAVRLLETRRATPQQRHRIAVLWGGDPRVNKALRGEFVD